MSSFMTSLLPKRWVGHTIGLTSYFKVRRGRGASFLSLLLSFSLFLVSLQRDYSSAEERVTLRLLMQALEASQWEDIVGEFNRDHPGIKLEVIGGPNATNLVEDLYSSSFLLGDSPYDLVYLDIVWVPKFAAAGWLLDLSSRVKKEELSDFFPATVEGGKYDGGLYRIPLRADAGMLYYRKDLLRELSLEPPKTFGELTTAANLAQEQGLIPWGFVWQGRQYEGLVTVFVEMLQGFGGYWIDAERREVGLDSVEAVKALQFLQSSIHKRISPAGVTMYQEEEARRLFQSGSSLFMRNWPYAWELAQRQDSPIKGLVGIAPMVHSQGHSSGACLGGWGLGIARGTPHPEEAWQVIDYFASKDVQKRFIFQNGYVPSRFSVMRDPEVVNKFPFYPDLEKVVESAVLRPPIAEYARASDILQRFLSAALSGELSAEVALQRAAFETRALLRAT